MKKFDELCHMRKSVVACRYEFYMRTQKDDEPFDHFLTDIIRLAKHCKFGIAIDAMIRDRIVLGVVNENLQARLLKTDNLDLAKATDICRTTELAATQPSRNVQITTEPAAEQQQQQQQQYHQQSGAGSTKRKVSTKAKVKCTNYSHLFAYGQNLGYGQRCKSCKKMHHFGMVSSKRDMNNGEESPKAILQDKDFILDCLCWHNEYRARHGAPALTVSSELCEYSQQWANHLASTNEFYYRSEKSMGQNLFCCPVSALVTDLTGQEVASYWYSTVRRYNYFKEAHLLHTNVNAGHFTQMVWINSRYFGVGKASSKTGKIFVVAYYFPPGNIPGQFHENCLPPVLDQDNLPPPPPIDLDNNPIPSLLKNSLMNNNVSGAGGGGTNNPGTSN